MVTFHDGPAHGVTLGIYRAPLFLRVTHDGKAYDCLNEIRDEARPEETLCVYVMTQFLGTAHIYARGGGGGWRTIANYRYWHTQPDDAAMRNNNRWREWQAEALKQLPPGYLEEIDFPKRGES